MGEWVRRRNPIHSNSNAAFIKKRKGKERKKDEVKEKGGEGVDEKRLNLPPLQF